MCDIVERLHRLADSQRGAQWYPPADEDLVDEAADEIERLRARIAELESDISAYRGGNTTSGTAKIAMLSAEITMLKAQLRAESDRADMRSAEATQAYKERGEARARIAKLEACAAKCFLRINRTTDREKMISEFPFLTDLLAQTSDCPEGEDMEARIAALEAALKPFASDIPTAYGDWNTWPVTVGDVLRAQEALKKAGGGDG